MVRSISVSSNRCSNYKLFISSSLLLTRVLLISNTIVALPSIVEDRILSSLSLTDMVITTQPQPPSQEAQDEDVECAPDGVQDEDISSSIDGAVATEYIRANDGAMEEDSERQTFEREIKEAIKHLEKESDMSAEVVASLQSTGMPGVDSELKTTDVTGSAMAEAEDIVTDQQTVIPRVAHTKITQPLEVSQSAANRGSDEEVTEQCDPQQ